MKKTVFYSKENFTCRVDDETLEYANPAIDAETKKRGWAQIRVCADGKLVKDERERDTGNLIVWDKDIDRFIHRLSGYSPTSYRVNNGMIE